MLCSRAQDWLFGAADPTAPPADVAEHLAACPACREVAAQIHQLETDWRSLPLPANLQAAKQRVLARAAEPAGRAAEIAPLRLITKRNKLVRWCMAAAALLAIGVGMYLALPDSEAQASGDVVDRLVDWNNELCELPLGERGKIFQASAEKMRAAAASPELSADDRDLAKTLLDNAEWLSKNADPLAGIARISAVADKLLAQIRRTAKGGKKSKLGKYARHFAKVDRTIQDSLERAGFATTQSPQQLVQLQALAQSEQHRHDALNSLLASVSKTEQRVIRNALESDGKAKAPKHKQSGSK